MARLIRIGIASLVMAGALAISMTGPVEAAPTAPKTPKAPIVLTVPITTTLNNFTTALPRDYSRPELAVPNTACWGGPTSITYLNSSYALLARPGNNIGYCYRNYVIISGSTWYCTYGEGLYLNINPCTSVWGPVGGATRSVTFDYDYIKAISGAAVDIDILNGVISPGYLTGTWRKID